MALDKKYSLHGERLPTASSFALYVDPHSDKTQIVQAEGTLLDEYARRVSPKYDSGHLACLHCSVSMRYVPRTSMMSGSTGNREIGYFSPIGSHDEDCLLRDPEAVHNFPLLDPAKGPRINIDTADLSLDFMDAVGVYEWRGAQKHLLEDDLLDRKVETVEEVSHVLKLIDNYLRGGKQDKLQSARFVFQNHAQSWAETVIPLGKPSRHADLVTRVMNRPRGGEPPFAVLEIKTTNKHDARQVLRDPNNKKSAWKTPPAPVDPVEIGKMPDGRKAYVQYGIYIDSYDKDFCRTGMHEPANYFVMGEVRGNHHQDFPAAEDTPAYRVYYLNMKVTDARQVIRKGSEDVLEQLASPRPRAKRIKPNTEVDPGLLRLTGE